MGNCSHKESTEIALTPSHTAEYYMNLENSIDQTIYNRIKSSNLIKSTETEVTEIAKLLVTYNRKNSDLCGSEKIFMLILLEFYNQCVKSHSFQQSKLKFICDAMRLHHELINTLTVSRGLFVTQLRDRIGNPYLRYDFVKDNAQVPFQEILFSNVIMKVNDSHGHGHGHGHNIKTKFSNGLTEIISSYQRQPDYYNYYGFTEFQYNTVV